MTPSSVIVPRLVCRHTRNIFARGRIPSAYFARVSNALSRELGNTRTPYRADLPLHIHTCDAQEKRTHPRRLLFGVQVGRRSAQQGVDSLRFQGVKQRRRSTDGRQANARVFGCRAPAHRSIVTIPGSGIFPSGAAKPRPHPGRGRMHGRDVIGGTVWAIARDGQENWTGAWEGLCVKGDIVPPGSQFVVNRRRLCSLEKITSLHIY